MSITETPTLTVSEKARLAADYIDARDWPEGAFPDIFVAWDSTYALVTIDTIDIDALRAARRVVGSVDRKESYDGFYFRATPYDGLVVHLRPPKELCERVQVGTREVPVYETTCPESVLALGGEA